MPSRRTLAAPILGFARSMPARFRHPACARCQGRLAWHRQPLAGLLV